jgi:DNA-binding NarL/FixJ family response regulator
MMTENTRETILIADDHPLFLKGLREVIDEETDWSVTYEALDGQQALNLILENRPDLAILDINMPERDGLEVARKVIEAGLSTSIIILTMYDDVLLFNRAASTGVKGFILKESAVEDIIDGIESVIRGETYVSPKLTSNLLDGGADRNMIKDVFHFKLSKTEQRIVRLIAEDFDTNAIAEELHISPKTVENHRSHLCKKLNLYGKNALLRYVLEHKNVLLWALDEY